MEHHREPEGQWRQLTSHPQVIDLTDNNEPESPRIRHQQRTTEIVEVLSDDDDDDNIADDGGVGPSTSTSTVHLVAPDSDDDEVQFIRETAPRPSAGPSSASASSSSSSSSRWRNVSLLESTLRDVIASRRVGSAASSSSRASSSHHRHHHSRSPSQGRARQPSATRRIVEMLAGTIERSGEQQRRLLQQQEQILRQIQERREMLVIQQQQLGGWLEANGAEGYHVRYNANNGRRVFEPNGQNNATPSANNFNNNTNNTTQQNPFYRNAPVWPEMMATPFPVTHPAYSFFPDLDYHFLPDPPSVPLHPTPAANTAPSGYGRSRAPKTARPGYTRTLDSEVALACPKCLNDFDPCKSGSKEDSKDGSKEIKVSMIIGCGHIICSDCAESMFLAKKPLKKTRSSLKKGKQRAASATALGKRRRSQDVHQETKIDTTTLAGEASLATEAASGGDSTGLTQGDSLLSDEDKDYEWIKRATGLCPACNRRVKPKAVVQLYV